MTLDEREAAIRIVCVDDHCLVRDGIALIVSQQPDMKVVGLAATGEAAVELVHRERPDVTLMDLQLPAMSGVEAIRQIRSEDPSARIIALTMHKGDEDIYRALNAGVATYVLKDTVADDLISVIRDVHSGGRPMNTDIKAVLDRRNNALTLTPREFQVLQGLYAGCRNKEVAASLGISEETVRVHVRNIFEKLNVTDRTAAINIALRRGILHLP